MDTLKRTKLTGPTSGQDSWPLLKNFSGHTTQTAHFYMPYLMYGRTYLIWSLLVSPTMAVNTIVMWNARSLLSKIADTKYFLSQYTPMVVGITESWLRPPFDPSFANYAVIRRDRSTGNGGGLLFLLHTSLPYKKTNLRHYTRGVLETLAIQIHSHMGWISLLLCYNPSKVFTKLELKHYVSQLAEPILIMGDFNAHHNLWEPHLTSSGQNGAGKSPYSFLTLTSKLSLITPPGMQTRTDPFTNRSSTLDLYIGTSHFQDSDLTLGPYMGSDHLPVILSFHQTLNLPQTERRLRWNFSDGSKWPSFTQTLNLPEMGNSTLNEAVSLTSANILDTGKRYFKLHTGKFGFKRQHIWWNGECTRLIKERNKAYNKWRSHPTQLHCISYRQKRATCKRYLREAKREAWRKITCQLNFSTSIKESWSLIKRT